MGAERLYLSVLVSCFVVIHCQALVPLVGWSNSDAFTLVKGHQFSGVNEFIYDAKLDSVDVIIVFKSPQLSFDALTKYGGAYGGHSALSSLQSEMEGSKSRVWAGVEGTVASDLVSTLSFILEAQPHVITGSEGVVSSKLLVVELTTNPEDQSGFAKQDAVISGVMSAIHSLPGSPSYAAMYTSSHTHLAKPRPQHQEVRRSAQGTIRTFRLPRQANSNTDFEPRCASVSTNASVCLLFCITDNRISRGNTSIANSMIPINVTDIQITDASCMNETENNEATVLAEVSVLDQQEPTLLRFQFPRGRCSNNVGTSNFTCGFWTMEVYVNDENTGGQFQRMTRATEEQFIFSQFLIPEGTAYACGDNDLNVYNPVPLGSTDGYRFFGLQAQVYSGIFNNTASGGSPSFGSVYNCQGYFTTVSLMGVVTAVILILILYCSIVFLFGLRTMDRFDDPRGATISVENLH